MGLVGGRLAVGGGMRRKRHQTRSKIEGWVQNDNHGPNEEGLSRKVLPKLFYLK